MKIILFICCFFMLLSCNKKDEKNKYIDDNEIDTEEHNEIEAINLEDINFSGNYKFKLIEIKKINSDLSIVDNLNEHIYINLKWKENHTYLLETNFKLLIELMNDFHENNPMEIEYPNYKFYGEYKDAFYQFAADGPNGEGTWCNIYYFENIISIHYVYSGYGGEIENDLKVIFEKI
jgi:hypothetical protein